MRTRDEILRLVHPDGRTQEVRLRYNASHQAGVRLFVGELAAPDFPIREDTPPSFAARGFAQAIAGYRKTVEPHGWRLLHAFARLDCWVPADEISTRIHVLTPDRPETAIIDGFEPATLDQVTTVANQRARYEHWKAGLAPIPLGRVRRSLANRETGSNRGFSPVAILAGKILVQVDDPESP